MSDSSRSLSALFDELVTLDGSARAAFLAQLEPELADRLRALLTADQAADAAIDAAIAIDAHAAIDSHAEGMRIGPWRVLRELGSGGMGTVLLAEREQADFVQQVAIKLIRGFPSQDGIRRLRQERQILATLDHPNIARLIDGGETEAGQPYLVVEYVRGLTLDAYVREHQPDRDARIQLIERIGAAVQHAHQHLVIHRDLKPANVMIRDDGEIKLLDFGVAKLLDLGADGASSESTRVFTPGYASPEQRAGQPISIASDVFSLGTMLREMLALGLASAPRFDAELSGIIAKACADEPTQRYATVAAFSDDLSRYRRGLPVAAAADTGWYRARKFVGRHRIASAATLAAIVVIAVLIWNLTAALQQARAERASADAARLQTEQSLQRSKSVIEFFAAMFEGVAPEHALGRSLAPADLLARAEKLLRDKPPADPGLHADLSTMLGSLYHSLGDGSNAVRLMQQGLQGQTPNGAEETLEIATRHLILSRALFSVRDQDQAMVHLEQAVALRTPFMRDDPQLQIDSALELATGKQMTRDLAGARVELDKARALVMKFGATPALRLNLEDVESFVCIAESRFAAGADAANAGLALLQQYPELDRTRIIQLERNLARGLSASGRLPEAEAAFARAVSAQEKYVGDSGMRAGSLYSDHAGLLATLGRFRESLGEYRRAADIETQAGGPAPESNPTHLANSCDTLTGMGDYLQALDYCRKAYAIHEALNPPEHPDRMIVESNLARILALTGKAPDALRMLQSLRQRATGLAGPDSFPVALHTVRAVRVALLAGEVDTARALGDEGVGLFESIFPSPHVWRARALRFRALALIADRDLDAADADLQKAHDEAAAGLPAEHPLLAQIDVDQAEVALLRGDDAKARTLIGPALEVLRKCCMPEEIDRKRAEDIAAKAR